MKFFKFRRRNFRISNIFKTNLNFFKHSCRSYLHTKILSMKSVCCQSLNPIPYHSVVVLRMENFARTRLVLCDIACGSHQIRRKKAMVGCATSVAGGLLDLHNL